MSDTPLRNTINHLRLCQSARAKGYQVSFTTDPGWLVNQAINRRAGWFDDPGCTRGSCLPVESKQLTVHGSVIVRNGRYPRKAVGETYSHLKRIARNVNTPNLIVRISELGEWRKLILQKMEGRITSNVDY